MSSNRNFNLHDGKTGSAIAVRITPRSSKNEIQEILDDGTIKIRITAPPVDGKANEELISYIAKILDVSVSKVEIVAGETSKNKFITILDLSSEQVNQKIINALKK